MEGSWGRAVPPAEQDQESARSWCHLAGSRAGSCSSACACATPLQFVGAAQGHSPGRSRGVSQWLGFLQPAWGRAVVWAVELQPRAPRNGDVCDCPFARLLLPCQAVTMAFAAAESRCWNLLVSPGGGPEHLGPFWELWWELWGCSGALQGLLLCSPGMAPGTVLGMVPVPPLLLAASAPQQALDSGALCRLILGWISLLST